MSVAAFIMSRGWCLAIHVRGRQLRRQHPRRMFDAAIKRETLQGRRAFTDERDARLTAFRWLNRYNTVRRHSRLGQRSPITYENSIRAT